MSRFTIGFRVLLGLVLILNGIGNAVASVLMTHSGAVETAASAEAVMDCHGDHEGQAVEANPVAGVSQGLTDDPSDPNPSCCESGACQCACMHLSQAAVSLSRAIEIVISHAGAVLPPKAGHAAPALPHLIRPPIG